MRTLGGERGRRSSEGSYHRSSPVTLGTSNVGGSAMIRPWPLLDQPLERGALRELLARICVRPPYFALTDLSLEGLELHATARAESPAYSEVGAMPAAELGRHAAIVGLTVAASRQADDDRRYYLARRAECRYV